MYTSLEELQLPAAAPITSDFVDVLKGYRFEVKGVATYAQREAIQAEINQMRSDKAGGSFKVITPAETFVPSDEDIVAACWAAGCVTQPATTAYEWLKFAQHSSTTLWQLYMQCLYNSREIGDKKQADGVEAAGKDLDADPLAPAG